MSRRPAQKPAARDSADVASPKKSRSRGTERGKGGLLGAVGAKFLARGFTVRPRIGLVRGLNARVVMLGFARFHRFPLHLSVNRTFFGAFWSPPPPPPWPAGRALRTGRCETPRRHGGSVAGGETMRHSFHLVSGCASFRGGRFPSFMPVISSVCFSPLRLFVPSGSVSF